MPQPRARAGRWSDQALPHEQADGVVRLAPGPVLTVPGTG